jgi:hypothetical protein
MWLGELGRSFFSKVLEMAGMAGTWTQHKGISEG